MYYEKIEDILNDLEDKELEIAGGSVVGMMLATVNSLIIYISNLTIGKKKYLEVEEEVKQILQEAKVLKQKSMLSIDKDKEVLEKILDKYKTRKDGPEEYELACKEAVEFALEVVEIAYKTKDLSDKISKVGNRMLASDFKICKYYSEASIKASKENYYINYNSIENEKIQKELNSKYNKILEKYKGE
ncbi:MAG: cyclodeaminase/cyclohydrolase family protein [Clostridia bacterium]|nr:cyclodeaminase/cyclohydrolase family protein [Clostridia bacterium]